MIAIRELLVKYLAYYFRSVKLPDSFRILSDSADHTTLVVQSHSIIIEGLLLSFARQAGFKALRYADGVSKPIATDNRSEKEVRWLCMYDSAAIQKELTRDSEIRFSTLSVFHLRGPTKSYPRSQPGFSWHLSLLFTRRFLLVQIGTPINSRIRTPLHIQRSVKLDYYQNLKLVRGTPFQTMSAQEKTVLSGSEFERELRILADRAGKPVFVMRRQARKTFHEIAANPRRIMYDILSGTASIILKRLFSEITINGLDKLLPAVKKDSVVLVPMHRSHLDGIIFSNRLYRANIIPPLVASGMNLAFWPAGFLIRSVGGYFVKRNARDRLHALILKRYVTYVTQRGHLQEFFIEGGRSRSGKMLQPKTGLLNLYVSALFKGLRKDILLVPVSFSYENVVEDDDYARENNGSSKSKENFITTIKAFGIFKRNHGDVVVNFGTPISLSRFCVENGVTPRKVSNKNTRSAEKEIVNLVRFDISRRIRNLTSPTLNGLVCSALMSSPGYALSRARLISSVHILSDALCLIKELVPTMGEFSPSLRKFLSGHTELLEGVLEGGTVRRKTCLQDEVFFIPRNRRFTGDYYRNHTIHYFFNLSFLSLLCLTKCGINSQEAEKLHEILQGDFLLPEKDVFQSQLNELLEALSRLALISGDASKFEFTEKGTKYLNPGLLLGSIQGFLWVYSCLLHNRSAALNVLDFPDGCIRAFSYCEFMKALQDEYDVAKYLPQFSRTEASSLSTLTSAVDSLCERQVISCVEKPSYKKVILLKSDCGAEAELLNRFSQAALDWFTANPSNGSAHLS